VARQRGGTEKVSDGFGRESNAFDLAEDDADYRAATEGDEDDMAGEKLEVRGIGKSAPAVAIDLCGNDLEKHRIIIT